MVNIVCLNGVYEVTIRLPRSSFNKELLQRIFGVSMETKHDVMALIKSPNFDDLIPKISNYLSVVKHLKL